jgi:hypothetical protein
LDGVGKVGPNIGNLSWRENVFKLSVNEAGYCTAGATPRTLAHRAARGYRQQQENRLLLEDIARKISGGTIGEERVGNLLRD